MAVEYGVEHLSRCMAAATPDVLRVALKRHYKAQLYLDAWRGYANLVLDRTKYVGAGVAGTNKAQIKQDIFVRADVGEHFGLLTAYETEVPPRDAFPTGWGDNWVDALD